MARKKSILNALDGGHLDGSVFGAAAKSLQDKTEPRGKPARLSRLARFRRPGKTATGDRGTSAPESRDRD